MTDLPAYCERCKSIFPFRGIAMAPGVTLGLENIATNCPVCGYGDARVSDGLYKATADAVEVLSGPHSTHAMALALKLVAERLKEGKISKEEAAIEAKKISPKYAALLTMFATHGATALTLLLSIIALYLQLENNQSSSVDAKKLLDAVTQQTIIMQDIDKENRVERQRQASSASKSEKEPAVVKNKSSRRAQVNKDRRDRNKTRRQQFGGARTR